MRRTNIWIMVMAVLLCLSVMSLVLIGCTGRECWPHGYFHNQQAGLDC